MDNFARCFTFTVAAEGGFSSNAADPGNWTGGVVGQGKLNGTKFGISASAYPTLDIKNLTEAAAEQIYRTDYWATIQGDQLPLPVALATFDASINSGPQRAVIWLQQSLGVATDGVLGPVTLAAAANGDAGDVARESLARRVDFSGQLADWPMFGLGWSRRFVALAAAIGA